MAATKFSVITTGNNPTFHVMVKEIPTECTYKIAVTIAKAYRDWETDFLVYTYY